MKNPDLAKRFSASIREINDWTNKNPGPAAAILSKYTKVPIADIEHMHRGEFPTNFDLGLVQPIIDAAVKYGVLFARLLRSGNRLQTVKRSAALSTLAALTATASLPAFAQTAPSVKVGTSPSDSFAEGIYAQGGGFFKDAGMNVELISLANSGALGAAVAGGTIDIGVGNLIAVANARTSGLQLAIIAPSALFIAKEPATVLIAAKNSSISTPKDLEGKTIASIEVRGTMQSSIREWITRSGADASSVKFVEMPFTVMAAALNAGRIDAAMIGEPALTAAKPLVRIIGNPYSAVAPEWYLNVWFATASWIEGNRAAAHAFAGVMAKTAAWANVHHAETARCCRSSCQLTDDVLSKMTRVEFGVKLTPQLMQPILDSAAKYGVLKTPVDAKELIYPGF